MGGCRCSYRGCKMRSDGQTHMFHFPVFNKMRCHQWITNSHTPHFLNLKLSQLKNRVICEHHFTDDSFMNFKRDKLKTNAVPTEDGPHCGPMEDETINTEDNDMPVIPINPDDIENETLNHVEKKAHSSVKYGDFLISDVTELFSSSHINIDSQASRKPSPEGVKASKLLKGFNSKSLFEESHNYTIIYSNDEPTKDTNETVSLNTFNTPPTRGIYAIQYEETEDPNKLLDMPRERQSESFNYSRNGSCKINPDKVVKILSEKTISEPVVVEGKLEPVSPSMIISRRMRKPRSRIITPSKLDLEPELKYEDTIVQASNKNIPEAVIEQTIPIEYTPINVKDVFEENKNVQEKKGSAINQRKNTNFNNVEIQNNLNNEVHKENETVSYEQSLLNTMIENATKLIEPEFKSTPAEKSILTPTSTPVFKTILKNKITPEKLAAIEAKRKFNLKLRDAISSCLDNLDERSEVFNKKRTPEKKQTVKRSICSKAPSPVSSQSNVVDYLENRLKKMEDTLLNKIDNNTQKINDLKRTLKPSKNVKTANTQTYLDHMTEFSQKQYLYKEISKFLSPNAIIKVYEELFLKADDEIETPTPRKLRKRR